MKEQSKAKEVKKEIFGCNTINPEQCKTCIFSKGEPPFEDSPMKRYCMIYTRESGRSKPESVYFNGAKCEYHNTGEDNEE